MRVKKLIFILLFLAGVALFTVSLLPFFRTQNEYFWVMTVAGGVATVIGLIGAMSPSRGGKRRVFLNSEYVRRKTILTKPEIELLRALREINPDKYEVIPQMALVNVIDKKTNTSYRNELFRVCDYCFVDRRTFEPLLLVELNDSSHERADRIERDEKVAAICEDAGLPLITFRMDEENTPSSVRRAVKRAILR